MRFRGGPTSASGLSCTIGPMSTKSSTPPKKSVPPPRSAPPTRTTGTRARSTHPPRGARPPPAPSQLPEAPLTQKLPRIADEESQPPEDESRTSQTAIRVNVPGEAETPVLMVLTGLSAGQVLTIGEPETIIGRSHDC